MKIPFSPPDITEEEIQEVTAALRSGWITTGPRTKELERLIAEYCHTSKAVCLNSATACMEMTLRILGIGPGDEVITTAYTYTATASVICHVGAVPVLIDTKKDSYEMDYEMLEGAITEKTKVIIPVDIGGVMCDYDQILKILEQNKERYHPSTVLQSCFDRVIILADAAHSFGAQRKGKRSGEAADFSAFSFHAVKNLTTGEGGGVVWRDREGMNHEVLYKNYMLHCLHGQSKDALAKTMIGGWEYDIVAPYYKCNMTDIMAAMGLVQIRRYSGFLKRRKEIAQFYNRRLESEEIRVLHHEGEDFSSSAHLYLIRLEGKDRGFCNHVISKMAEAGIATNVHYKPLPLLTAYKEMGFDIQDFPNAYAMYENGITLPLHTRLTEDELCYITETLLSIIKNE